jgi:hypothetical protein
VKASVKLDRYTCDGCGKEYVVEPNDEPPHGYHGRHTHITPWGGDGGEWFACGKSCIVKAIDASEDHSTE